MCITVWSDSAGQMAKHNELCLSTGCFHSWSALFLAILHWHGHRVCSHACPVTRPSQHNRGLLLFMTCFTETAADACTIKCHRKFACTRAADLTGSLRQDAPCCSIQWLQPPSYPIQALSWTPSTVRGQPTPAGATPACPSSSALPAAFASPLSSPSPRTNGFGSSSCGELPASYTSLLLPRLHQISVMGFSWC